MRNTPQPRRIALLMPRANVHTRGIFRGVTRYARPFRAWNFHLGLPHTDVIGHLRRWRPAGIIATIPDARLEGRIASLDIPLVNCSSDVQGGGVDRVVTSNQAVGALAAEHFLDRGYRQLAFCGEARSLASRQRHEWFRRRADHAGVIVHTFVADVGPALIDEIGWTVSSRDRKLQGWIKSLPKPIGLLVCHDTLALLLSEVCREIGVRVPGEVAILGVDNDAMLCEMAYPSLSSVQTPQELIGFEAARRLDELMHRRRVAPRTTTLPATGVVTRQSTDALVADDPLVAEAMQFIQEHADQAVRVTDVAAHLGVSRRALEYRFKAEAGQTVLAAIQHAHVALANRLLQNTDWPLDRIAAACGFNSRERLSHVYRQLTGRTPRHAFPKRLALT